MNVVLATGLLYSFHQADLQGKVIVCVLGLMSAITWTVMFTKWQHLRRARRGGRDLLAQFRNGRDPLHLFINNVRLPDCPLHSIYRLGAEEISGQFGNPVRAVAGPKTNGGFSSFSGHGGGTALAAVETELSLGERSLVNLDALRGVLGRAIDAEIMRMEAQMSVLSTAVTGGPFLGLLGSAWGVMSVFASMGEQGNMRLGAVAPGISAALLATVVGLLVAVPSLFGYNLLAAQIRRQTMEMEGFAEEFASAVERNYATS